MLLSHSLSVKKLHGVVLVIFGSLARALAYNCCYIIAAITLVVGEEAVVESIKKNLHCIVLVIFGSLTSALAHNGCYIIAAITPVG